MVTSSSMSWVPPTSCERAMMTSSLGCKRMVSDARVSMTPPSIELQRSRLAAKCPALRAHDPSTGMIRRSCKRPRSQDDLHEAPWSGADHLHLGALVLVRRRVEGLDRIGERVLAGQQRPHVDSTRREILHGPVELDAPAERAAKIELLRHDV